MAKGKLKGLFKKKEGGSPLGNAVRFVADKFTGGTYSSIFPKPTDKDIESDPDVVYAGNSSPSTEALAMAKDATEKEALRKAKNKKMITTAGIVTGVFVVLGIIAKVLFFKKK